MHRRSVGRGHPLQQLTRLHAASLARSVRSDNPVRNSSRVSCYARRCLRGRPHPPSLEISNCSGPQLRGSRARTRITRRSAPSSARLSCVSFRAMCAHGRSARAVTGLDQEAWGILVGGASHSKRLARAVVVCARGSMRVSELAAGEDTARRPARWTRERPEGTTMISV